MRKSQSFFSEKLHGVNKAIVPYLCKRIFPGGFCKKYKFWYKVQMTLPFKKIKSYKFFNVTLAKYCITISSAAKIL